MQLAQLVDRSKDYLAKKPVLKQILKTLLMGAVKLVDLSSRRRYHRWFLANALTREQADRQRRAANTFRYRPLISIVVPVYNPPLDFFDEMLTSVYSQTYQHWELILVDDASPDEGVRDCIRKHVKRDRRIRAVYLKTNKQIAGATNVGIDTASGEFIGLLDNDDIIQPDALYEVVRRLNENKALNLIYTDEDKFTDSRRIHHAPYFKPGWNPEFLRSVNYITHFAVVRASVLRDVGGERSEFNGAQDWELFLRLTRQIDTRTIAHIPKVLYSWRIHEHSTAKDINVKPYVVEAQRRALVEDTKLRARGGYRISQDVLYPAQWVMAAPADNTTTMTIICDDKASTGIDDERHHWVCSEGPITSDDLVGDVIVFAFRIIENIHGLDQMIIDAMQEDVGYVVCRGQRDIVTNNIAQLINKEALEFVRGTSAREMTRHFYTTTRYNVPSVLPEGIIMIEKRKLISASSQLGCDIKDTERISQYLDTMGVYNLYNPHVRC